MWAKIYIFSIPLFFLSLAAKKKRSWLLCVYCAVYALSCNILIIRCFFGCLGGCSANVKIWLAVFAWANDYSPLQCRKILIRCPADRNPSKTESNHSNRMFCLICCYLPDFSRSDFLISFGASAPLSNRSTQPPINRRNVACLVSTHQIEYQKRRCCHLLHIIMCSLSAENLFLRLLYNHVVRSALYD